MTLSAQDADGDVEQEEEDVYYEVLIRKARNETVADRALAMKKLGRIGLSDALPVLEEGLNDDDQRVRLAALDALRPIDHPSANLLLKEALFNGEDPVLASTAAELITKRSPSFGIPLLLEGLNHESKVIRSSSFSALEQWTGFRFSYSPAANPDERKKAVRHWRDWWEANRERTEMEWWRNHIRGADTDVHSVRSLVAAIQRVSQKRCWDCVPELITLLDHRRGPVRIQALHGLRRIAVHRFEGGDDPRQEGVERIRSRWLGWWDQYGSTSRSSWLIELLRVHALLEQVPHVIILPGRIQKLLRELSSPDVKISKSQLSAMLNGSRGEQAYAVRILRQRTGLAFGYAGADRPAQRRKGVEKWQQWWEQWGDQSMEARMVYMLEQGEQPMNRKVAARYLETNRSSNGVRALIHSGLTDSARSVRERSITSLMYVTGRRFDYRADASEEERTNSIQRWKKWWTDQDQPFPRK